MHSIDRFVLRVAMKVIQNPGKSSRLNLEIQTYLISCQPDGLLHLYLMLGTEQMKILPGLPHHQGRKQDCSDCDEHKRARDRQTVGCAGR